MYSINSRKMIKENDLWKEKWTWGFFLTAVGLWIAVSWIAVM